MTATADGTPIASVADAFEVSVDPGEHVFDFSAEGYVPQTVKLALKENMLLKQSVVFEKTAPPPPPAPVAAVEPQGPPSSAPPSTNAAPANTSASTPATGLTTSADAASIADRRWIDAAPVARAGAPQLGLRLGVNNALDNYFGVQYALTLEGGWKFTRSEFAGLYLSGAYGSPGVRLIDECPVCKASSGNLRVGGQYIHSFYPGERFNLWIGGAIGFTSSAAGIKNPPPKATPGSPPPPKEITAEAEGLELRLLLGLDVRVTEKVAVGFCIVRCRFRPSVASSCARTRRASWKVPDVH